MCGALAVAAVGCSPHLLVVVDPCDEATAAGSPAGTSNPLLRDVVGWWRLDDGTGSMIARDSSCMGNDGVLVNLVQNQDWVPGRSGDSLDLRGAGYVLVPHSPSIDSITDQITALGNLRTVLPTHYADAWLGLLSSPMQTDDLVKGIIASLAYATVFFSLAWWRFLRKDVVS